ncbi:hypothetical protein KIF53_15815 [Chromobacterium subtsugae]|uniref:Uncharacterized protein n=1 Tax=Chromobacterium subtsugae TaxID=251747 RepID=A0ABS7FGA2_9NEIS|nr:MULTISPECIES: hypothetical protein [Chromobacterium]KUM02695.1 hypothetical protein Cv017_01200 [Chromobacterium subtsugae]KZE84913.1 hypothetical protein AWB61_02745 [Chromobacterium sp. F49]MBW7567873.1 hypothetical protein [Chromobacterium subtsugae]MBW8289100.1 hypothetical protein [Chromobacterium subtsugae]OBU85422.1 hypothetical protein MY55_16555 [Chromobacterium subtsugae]
MPHLALSTSRQAALAAMQDDASDCLMVDSFNGAPANMRGFRCFNPFQLWPDPVIPVPGQAGRLARSVESVWQGLKLVDGRTDFEQFLAEPRKRPSDDERRRQPGYCYSDSRFIYGDRQLGLLEARFLIYLPTYLFLLDRLAPEPVLRELRRHIAADGPVLFYDWDANQDIADTSSSFSHSAILAAWFNGTLERRYRELAGRLLSPADKPAFDAALDGLLGRYRAIHREKP